MSAKGKAFFERWVKTNITPETVANVFIRLEQAMDALRIDADEAGISMREMTESVGDLGSALTEAIRKTSPLVDSDEDDF